MQDANYGQKVSGKQYLEFLLDLHQKLKPETYLEVGVQTGISLQQSSCASIGVDPEFICKTDIIGKKPTCFLYQMASDDFFAKYSPSQIFGQVIDLAFLDGMHWFEFLLRDFMNTEKHCAARSTIVLHDCLPPGFIMTSRNIKDSFLPETNFRGWWTGDVWKIVPTLLKYRPDLSVTVTDCMPTGLVIISNLDPENAILSENYDEILAQYKEMDREEYEEYWKGVQITPASEALNRL